MATIYKRSLGRGLSKLIEDCYSGIREFEITEAESIYKNSNNLRPLIVRCFELEDEYNSIKHKNHDVTLPVGFGVSILLYDKYSPDLYNFKCKWYEDKISKIKESIKKIEAEKREKEEAERIEKARQDHLKLLEKERLEREKHEAELKKEREAKAKLEAEIRAKKTKQVKPKKTYLIKNLKNGFYKIGFSNNPIRRERTLQAEEPTIKMVKVWDKFIEKELHDKYKDQRVRGEWFKLTSIQVKYICTHY